MFKIKNKLKEKYRDCTNLQKIFHILKDWRLLFLQIIYAPFHLSPIQKNKIVIVSYFGDGFGDSGKRIIEYMQTNNILDKYSVYWALSNKENINTLPDGVKGIQYGSSIFYYHMSTAKFWIDNSRKYEYPFKRKQQIYIQTWHGGLALKKIEADSSHSLSDYYVRNAMKDSSMIDLFTSNSKFQTELIKKSFWYDGEIAEVGTPRVDYLLQNDNSKNKVMKKLDIPSNKKIILYAPTFRNEYNSNVFINDFEMLESKLKDSIFLVRHHPNNKDIVENQIGNNVIDVTDYPDMYELMKAADILITDYSSSMFEFSFMKKPVFLYIKDYQEYIEERGIYFNLEELPYIITNNEEELAQLIKEFEIIKYQSDLSDFFKKIELYETGNASKHVYKYIKSQIKEGNCDC